MVSGALAGWLPPVVVVFGLLLTSLSVIWERDRVATADRQAFSTLTERLRGEIARRVGVYRYGLMGTRSALATRGKLTRAEFRRLVAARNMPVEFPGALGIGYIERVERGDIESFLVQTRADEAPDFAVKSSGAAADLMIIKYVAPLPENDAALGSDIGREPRRRAAAECAMLSGEACVSEMVELVQAADSGPGFLYLLPHYRTDATPATSEARRRELLGFIYMPLLARDIFAGAAAITEGNLDFEVFTGESTTREHLVYDDDHHLLDVEHQVTAADFADRRLHVSVPLYIGKQRWTATMSTTAKFRGSRSFAWELAAGGAALSILLGLLLQVIGEAGRKARSLASAMTSELQKLATIVERSTNLVLTTDPEQRITWVNEGFTRVTGYTLEEVIGKRPSELLQFERTDPNTKAEMREKLLRKQPYRGEILNRGKDGREFWLDVNIQPLFSEQDELVGFMAIESDITVRKRAEAEVGEAAALLSASNAALEEAQAVGRLGNWMIDTESFAVTWSKQLYRLFERDYSCVPSYEESLAQFAPEDAERLDAAARRALRDGTEFSITARTRPGIKGARYLRCDGRVRFESGRVVGLYGTVIDMTAEVEREEALRFARERAEDASRSKSEFLANMSHEIRTPMAAILGYAELLADELRGKSATTSQLEHIATIRRNGEHLLTIINDILDISKIEAGKLTVERSEVQVDKVAADVLSTLSAQADAKGIALSVHWLAPIPRVIHTDAVRLRQILLNLIGNSLKFTERGSVEVSVDYEPHAARLRIAISDTGIGISPEQGGRLFEAFSQADSSTTRRFGGSGLGLRISKRLAQALGGDLSFRSELGKGSVFTLTVACGVSESVELFTPGARGPTSAPASPPVAAPNEPNALVGVRILLAEDGVDNQRLIAFHLRRAGAEVRIVDNGKLALAALTSSGALDGPLLDPAPVEVVVSDIQMPEMDGYAVAQILKRLGFRGVLIALTAHAMESERRRCLAAGFHDHLAKPVDRVELVQTILRALAKVRAGDGNAQARAAS